jgi:Sec-independent protein translocase protein TatA
MELFGIGPLELFFILLIALIILGPKDMVKAGLTLGRLLRKIITSPEWHTIQKASREMRNLPNRLMREASLEDLSKEMNDINKIGGQLKTDIKKIDQDLSSWTTPPDPVEIQSNQIEPDAPNIQIVDSRSKPDSVNDDSS